MGDSLYEMSVFAKVVATGSALTNYNFIAHYGLPIKDKAYGIVCTTPMDAPGVKLICRNSYEFQAAVTGSPFDYPANARLYVPRGFPKPSEPHHPASVALLASRLARALGGRTFVLTTTPVPEASTLAYALMGIGLLSAAARRRRAG